MIFLWTGRPGHSKTANVLARYKGEKRQVFYHGIKELKLPWQPWEPHRWQELEKGSIFIIDEAQDAFPVRGRGEPPHWINELAKHRHSGIDIVLITQNPMMLDSFVRRLVEQHWHIERKFGTRFVTLHEFQGVKEEVAKSREGSVRHEGRIPKEVFGLYKSSEEHTGKARIPMRVWLLLALPFVIAAIGVYGYYRFQPDAVVARVGGAAASGQAVKPQQGGAAFGQQGPVDLIAMHHPRVPDLAYTAPVYDEVTRPVQAPYPAACVTMGTRCSCYTQQATRLAVSDSLCRDIVAGGFFVAWQAPAGRDEAAAPPDRVERREGPAQALGGAIGIGAARPVPVASGTPRQ